MIIFILWDNSKEKIFGEIESKVKGKIRWKSPFYIANGGGGIAPETSSG